MESVLEKHRWEALAEGLPDDAVRIVRKAEEVLDRLNTIVGMVARKQELDTIEENLEVMRLGVSIESLVNMIIAQVKLRGGNNRDIDQLVTEFRNLVREVQESQKSGSFASTPKGTAEYIVRVVNIMERVYNILLTSKLMWMRELGVERLPRKTVKEDVEATVRKYFDLLVQPAIEQLSILDNDMPKSDPETTIQKFAYYILVIPQIYIPRKAYVHVVAKLFKEKKYKPLVEIVRRYVTKQYTPYSYEAPQVSKSVYVISNAIEMVRVDTALYLQSSIDTYLDSIDLDLVFSKLKKYTKDEIETTITALREKKNIDLFWDIFVRVALRSVGVHVEWEFEEEAPKKKKKKKPKVEETAESFEIEIPPEVEQELSEILGGM